MNRVFEDFVVVALREALRLSEPAVPARRKTSAPVARPRTPGPAQAGHLLVGSGECVFVGDVKYKRVQVAEIEHPDLYQLLAYTIATELPGGLLIYAADEATPVEHEIRSRAKRLRVTTLDLRDEPDTILRRVQAIARNVLDLRGEAARDWHPASLSSGP